MCIGFSQGVTLFSFKEKRIITFQFIQYVGKSESNVLPLTTLDVQVSTIAEKTCHRMQRKGWVLSDRDALSKKNTSLYFDISLVKFNYPTCTDIEGVYLKHNK
jgi:hypothetical protein